jgi:two-component system, OmpR family, response regulator
VTPAPGRVLIVEDDPDIRTLVRTYLEGEGFEVYEAGDGATMRATFDRDAFDLALIDLSLPDDDGLNLIQYIKERSDAGIIVLTGKADPVDHVVGLEMGADDYLTKPFVLRVLLARIKSLLRRTRDARNAGLAASGRLSFRGWVLDPTSRQLTAPNGASVALTTAEYNLLFAFLSEPNAVLSRDALCQAVYGRTMDEHSRSIDVLVGRLRRKLETGDKDDRDLIRSVRGSGYLLAAPVRNGR